MQANHPYEEIRNILIENSFCPSLATRIKNKSKIIEGLRIDSPHLLKDERGEKIRNVVGDQYVVTWMGDGDSNSYFLIKKK